MTTIKLLSVGLIATAIFAAPVMARDNHSARRHVAREANTITFPTTRYSDGNIIMPSPRVGGLPAPPDGENCDVGDEPFIC
jgi:hypothetical protein